MKLIIDIRETQLIEKIPFISGGYSSVPSTISISKEALPIGDLLLKNDDGNDILLFERKSFSDLLASIKDGRYEEQSHRLIHTSGLHPHNIVYIIEGVFAHLRNSGDKKVIQSAMTSLSYFKGFSVLRSSSTNETAELVWGMALKLQKEFEKGKQIPVYRHIIQRPEEIDATTTAAAGSEETEQPSDEVSVATHNTTPPIAPYCSFVKKTKSANITPENIGEILLCQIPGISSASATEIMSHFGGSFYNLITELKTNPEKLDTIYLESAGGKKRKLGSNIIKNIRDYLVDK